MEENDRIIAKFLGVRPNKTGWFDGYELHKAGLPFKYGAEGNGTRDLRFHNDWNWLMPVVEKIESLNLTINDIETSVDVQIIYGDCIIRDEDGAGLYESYHHSIDSADKRESAYKAVVEFIKWYNNQK